MDLDPDVISLLVCVVAVLSFVGNVLITIVGLKLPAHPKNLTQVFLISLAVADLLLSVQVPFYIMGLKNIVLETKTINVLCSISSFLLYTSIKANIFMVTIMGIDRMAATCFAGMYISKVKRKYAIVACIFVWVVSVVLAAVPGIIAATTSKLNPYHFDKRFQTCTVIPDFCERHDNDAVFLIYFLIEIVVTFGVPLIVIVVCYFMICSRIFNLQKIKTIGRSFSKKRKILSAKLGVSENKAGGRAKVKEIALGQSSDSAQQGKDFRDQELTSFATDKGYETQFDSESTRDVSVEVRSKEPSQVSSGFRLNIPKHSGFKTNPSPTPSRGQIFLINDPTEGCNNKMQEGASMVTCSDMVACSDIQPTPLKKDPPAFSIDPTMQRRRFNFFTTDVNDEFAVCPEPDAKPGLIANSIQVIEKHYNAIESARDELAKKMRVYKYQIRVARTAIVVCTFFVVCYMAYEIGILYVLWGVHCDESDSQVANYVGGCHVFLFVNSALNVLIYGMMHRTVRADIKKIVTFCTKKMSSDKSNVNC